MFPSDKGSPSSARSLKPQKARTAPIPTSRRLLRRLRRLGLRRLRPAPPAATHLITSLRTKRTFLLPPRTQLPVQRIRRRQGTTDASEIAATHVALEILVHVPAAGVVRERDQGAVLVCVEIRRVRQRAHARFVFFQVRCQELCTLGLGDGWV